MGGGDWRGRGAVVVGGVGQGLEVVVRVLVLGREGRRRQEGLVLETGRAGGRHCSRALLEVEAEQRSRRRALGLGGVCPQGRCLRGSGPDGVRGKHVLAAASAAEPALKKGRVRPDRAARCSKSTTATPHTHRIWLQAVGDGLQVLQGRGALRQALRHVVRHVGHQAAVAVQGGGQRGWWRGGGRHGWGSGGSLRGGLGGRGRGRKASCRKGKATS